MKMKMTDTPLFFLQCNLSDLISRADGNQAGGFPRFATVADIQLLREIAKKKLGKRFADVRIASYGGKKQIEIRAFSDGYHGRTKLIKATYQID